MSAVAPQADRTNPLDDTPLTRYQILIIAFVILTAVLDGFDTFAMAFVAPVVAREWQLDSAVLGILLSSGFAGMALGSFFISPIADVRGRKPVLLGSMVLMTIGCFISAISDTVPVLAASRVLTGLGLGSAISLTTSIAAEFSNARWRTLIVTIASQGFPVGNILGGLASALLLETLGWRSVFLTGGIAGVALIALLAVFLLESPSYILAKRAPDALPRLNRVLTKLGHAPLAELPPVAPQRERTSYRALFVPGQANVTIQLMLVNMFLVIASFYLLSWLPQFVTSSGFSPTSASLVAAITASVGVVGGLLLGTLAVFVKPARVAATSMVVVGIAVAMVGLAGSDLTTMTVAAATFGFFLAGSIGLLYAIMTQAFPPLARTSGMGLVLGAGRIAGAAGPAIAGALFAAGLARWEVSAMFAAGPIAAGIIILRLKSRATA